MDYLFEIVSVNLTEGLGLILKYLPEILTALLVYFNFGMMRASRDSIKTIHKQIELSYRPNIDFELIRYPNHLIYLIIKNSGKLNAMNVSLSVDKDFLLLGGRKKNIKEASIFSKVIRSITPGTKISLGLMDIGEIENLEHISPSQITITAKYSWVGHVEPVIEKTDIDLNLFVGSGLIVEPDLLYELIQIQKTLQEVRTSIQDLKPPVTKGTPS